jgi:DNA-binding transcriptional MerR regulator
LAGFREIWTETVRRINATITEAEAIRFTRADGTVVWVQSVILGILIPGNDAHHLITYGITENGHYVKDEFWEGIDDYPDEVAPLIPALIETATHGADETPLSPGDVAREFGVTQSQVANWDKTGVLKASFRTPGGQRRYRRADVTRLRSNPPVRSLLREDVSTEEITRLRDTENLTWKEIGLKLRMSAEGVRLRYNKAQSYASEVEKHLDGNSPTG